MSSNPQEADRTESLRSELVRGIVEETGVTEAVALPFANSILAYLQRTRPGERLYIPQPPRQYDLLQIQADLQRGVSVARVCRRHNVSRSTLHKLFPGGLPIPEAAESA
ncbi:MAG: hypothetical protein GX761_06025 [Gammaproteobacteria bacterium]|nr:hypothetical protein [Gammaproteobacteria bacterium]